MKRSVKQNVVKVVKWILYLAFVYYICYLVGQFRASISDDNVFLDTGRANDVVFESKRSVQCPGISIPSNIPADGTWQAVDTAGKIYILSAYYSKERNSVFVVGVRPDPRTDVPVICQLWSGEKGAVHELIEETEARQPGGWDYRGYTFTSTVYECHISKSKEEPHYVSMVTKKCASPSNIIRSHSVTKEFPYQRRLTVCLKPLILGYDQTLQFSKWVEINKLLGVEKFVVYNYSCGASITRLLEYYSEKGIIEVVQWRPPFVVNGLNPETRAVQLEKYGEVAALNDCLFRNKKYSQFISNIGINEFIIPRQDNISVIEMIDGIGVNVDVYHISRAFINRVAGSGKETQEVKTTVHTGLRGKRISKLVIRTAAVDFTVMGEVPAAETFIVPPRTSVLHVHPGTGHNQLLGTVIDEVLSHTQMDIVKADIENIKMNVENIK